MSSQKKNLLNQLLQRLNKIEQSLPFDESRSMLDSVIQEEQDKFQKSLKDNPNIRFLNEINRKLESFKRDFDLAPIIQEIELFQTEFQKAKDLFESEQAKISSDLKSKVSEISALIEKNKSETSKTSAKDFQTIIAKIDALEEQLSYSDKSSNAQKQSIKDAVMQFDKKISDLYESLRSSEQVRTAFQKTIDERFVNSETSLKNVSESLDGLRKDIFSRMSQVGGGNANRNIAIGGNGSVLSKYTDINIKAGSNVTLTYSNNDTTKYLDLTIASSGGGSVGGVVRSINSIATSTSAGATSGTDYVYVCTAGVAVTMPTAASNTNLYTIKNVSNSSVLVATTGGETIDDATTALLSIKYTSVDLVSDGGNWKVT